MGVIVMKMLILMFDIVLFYVLERLVFVGFVCLLDVGLGCFVLSLYI